MTISQPRTSIAMQIINEANECIANNERFIARSKWWDFGGRAAARKGIDYNTGRINAAMNVLNGDDPNVCYKREPR